MPPLMMRSERRMRRDRHNWVVVIDLADFQDVAPAAHQPGDSVSVTDFGAAVGFGPLLYRYWSSLYRKPEQDGAALAVSNGVGNWLPLRTRAPAEIVHLTLRSAAPTAA